MSSGSRRMWEDEQIRSELKLEEKRLIFLNKTAQDIQAIKPGSQEFQNLKFILENKEKIIRNRKFIEVLG
ncbi:MAG: hypothetical protein PF448_12995 [Bacteroidales bacterium]|jgi:hypothetical protein|nr:hypothetical protein [Bacteroidales bacterium]